jgi:hypothetical protein
MTTSSVRAAGPRRAASLVGVDANAQASVTSGRLRPTPSRSPMTPEEAVTAVRTRDTRIEWACIPWRRAQPATDSAASQRPLLPGARRKRSGVATIVRGRGPDDFRLGLGGQFNRIEGIPQAFELAKSPARS